MRFEVKSLSFVFTFVAVLLTFCVANANGKGAVVDVTLRPAGEFKAKTDDLEGEAVLEGDTVTAKNIVVGLKDLKTGITLRDKHAKEKYLQVDKYPEAILVYATGKGGKGEGRLKIRGIENDIQGTYEIDGDFLKADFPIKLSDFGITGIRYMGLGVDDTVQVHVKVPLKKK